MHVHHRRDGAGEPRPLRAARDTERFRLTQWIRAAVVALVLLCLTLVPGTLAPSPGTVLVLTVAFTALVIAGDLAVRRELLPVRLTTAGLIGVDAGYLAVATFVSGGTASPVVHVLLLHLAAVTLLLGARVGAALTAGDAVLVLSTAVAAGPRSVSPLPHPWQQLGVLLAVLATVAASSGTLVVMNRRELRRRRRDLEALTSLTERVERAAQPAAVAELLLEAVVSTYGLRRGVVVLTGPEGELSLLATSTPAEGAAAAGSSRGVWAATSQHRAVHVSGVARDEPWLAQLLPGADQLVVVPLMADERPLGAVVVEAGGSPRHQRRIVGGLQRSAAYGALALRHAWLLESVQQQAVTDELTRIANRRAFEEALERELSRATRRQDHVSLVLLDLDRFKDLNDRLGHQAGDEVLRRAAAALAEQCREFDLAARYGGEEFAVVLPGAGPEQALQIAERMREAVAASGTGAGVTASAGVATYPAHAGDAESLVRAADEALYRSKRGGRDRSTVAPELEPEEQLAALVRRAVHGLTAGRAC